MPLIWIGKIRAPEQVPPGMPFRISWDTWYIGLPFRKLRLISQIGWRGNLYRRIHIVRPRLFRKKKRTAVCIPGIAETTTFTISVGWRD